LQSLLDIEATSLSLLQHGKLHWENYMCLMKMSGDNQLAPTTQVGHSGSIGSAIPEEPATGFKAH